MDFFVEWLMNGWIGDNLRQAIADGYFASGEDLAYFFKYVFLPLSSVVQIYTLPFIIAFAFGFLLLISSLVDILIERIRLIYCRLRYGKVIHLYSPEKEVK